MVYVTLPVTGPRVSESPHWQWLSTFKLKFGEGHGFGAVHVSRGKGHLLNFKLKQPVNSELRAPGRAAAAGGAGRAQASRTGSESHRPVSRGTGSGSLNAGAAAPSPTPESESRHGLPPGTDSGWRANCQWQPT